MEFTMKEYRKGFTIVNVCGGCKYEDRSKPCTPGGPPPCFHPEAPEKNPVHGCPLKIMR